MTSGACFPLSLGPTLWAVGLLFRKALGSRLQTCPSAEQADIAPAEQPQHKEHNPLTALLKVQPRPDIIPWAVGCMLDWLHARHCDRVWIGPT